MINNVETIKNKYECNKIVSDYLIYVKHFPLLGAKNGRYYFAYNFDLWDTIKHFPLHIRVASLF
jgi:hypothetical protein